MVIDFNIYFSILLLLVSWALTMFALYGVIRLAVAHERASARRTASRK